MSSTVNTLNTRVHKLKFFCQNDRFVLLITLTELFTELHLPRGALGAVTLLTVELSER